MGPVVTSLLAYKVFKSRCPEMTMSSLTPAGASRNSVGCQPSAAAAVAAAGVTGDFLTV